MEVRIFTLICCLFASSFLQARDVSLEDGDIVFQRSMSRQSHAIEAATHSSHTHVGIVFHERGVPYIYEAVQPVKKTRLTEWGRRGKNGSYVVRRLKDKSKVDTRKLKREVTSFLGKDYDSLFGWSDSSIYCSELVWKAYDRACNVQIGKLRKLKELDLSHPIVKQTLKDRYGSRVPLNMTVISPADIFASRLLYTVSE